MADGSHWPSTGPLASTGPLIGRHRVITGDCLEVLAAMEPESIDAVVTSPPYNLNLAYASYQDSKTDADYLDWLCNVGAALRRVLRPDGSVFLNLSGSPSRPWLPFEAIVRLRPLFHLQNHITWVKSIAVGSGSAGHYKPVGGARFLHHTHEHVFHLTLTGRVPLDRLAIGVPFQDKSNIERRGHARDLRCRGNTWFIPYVTVRSKSQKFNHPGAFPVELPLWCLHLTGLRSPVVLDPFAGTGSTLVAAGWAGGHGIGIEVDASYGDVIRARLEEDLTTRRIVLDEPEMQALLHDDPMGTPRTTPRMRMLLASLRTRLNKTSGSLALTAYDQEQLQRCSRHPEARDPLTTALTQILARP
jgi:site-specific DNA-methyltransferase (adenine-specific)